MDQWKRRALGYALFVVAALVVTSIGYQWGMRVFEGRPRTFADAFQFAVEMFTTTGFGGDSPWQSSEMHVFIAVADLLGMVILVGALPVVVGPLLDTFLSTSAPRQLEDGIRDHVVICSYTSRAEELSRELDSHDVAHVIVEPDGDRADELHEAGHRVIKADPESTDGLEAARLADARALFADLSDEVDASIVLAAKEVAADVPVVSVVEDPNRGRYHQLAGADHVLSPRRLLGESLARKVTTALRAEVDEAYDIDGDLQLAEVSIRHGSDLAGVRLGDSGIRERTGANVIGAWERGEFVSPPSPGDRLAAGTVLLVSGRPAQLEELVEMTNSTVREFQAGETIVVGYGEVGRAVSAEFDSAGIQHTVIDSADQAEVDVVGDATEPDTLRAAGVADARTVVLALPDDTTTEFATLVVRDLAPETEIVARVQEKDNASKTYRAGADYVLSLSAVTGRMAASHLLEDRDVLSMNQQVEVVRTAAPGMVGETIAEADVRNRTGCSVIAIERDGQVVTDVEPETTIAADDELVIVGTDEGVRAFEQLFT